MRQFETGATRDADDSKLDYEGFLSPDVLARYAQYMHQHRVQADGEIRDSDNWQKGIPTEAYMKSLWRHFMELWTLHRRVVRLGGDITHEQEIALQEALCAILFNTMGYLFEELSLVGMHLPDMDDMDEDAAEYLKLTTLAPQRDAGLDPLEAEEQVRPNFPCDREDMRWDEDAGSFVPNRGKGCGA